MFASSALNAMPAANHPSMTNARPRAILTRRDRLGCMPHTLPQAKTMPLGHRRAGSPRSQRPKSQADSTRGLGGPEGTTRAHDTVISYEMLRTTAIAVAGHHGGSWF